MINGLRDGHPDTYILVDRVAFAVDLMTWARWKADNTANGAWIVGKAQITPKCEVSTVFLGLDHNYGRGDPLIFETMIFGGPLDNATYRYSTWVQAEAGHAELVTAARIACAQVNSIKEKAGAS